MSVLALALIVQTTFAAPATEYPSYSNAYHKAAKTGKPIVVLVCATWCGPCQTMKSSILPEVRRRGVLGNFEFALVDVDEERKLVEQLGGSGPIPQLICFRKGKGQWFRSKIIGCQEADKVTVFLRNAVSKHDVQFKKATANGQIGQKSRPNGVLSPQSAAGKGTDQAASKE